MYYFIKAIVDPYTLLLIILGLTLMIGLRGAIQRYRWIQLGFGCWLLLFLLSTPLISRALLESLESQTILQAELPEEVDAIIILGAGVIPPDEDEKETLLSIHSRERCRHGWRLYTRYQQPEIILCGSKIWGEAPGLSEAAAMKQYLIQLGINNEHLQVEEESLSTFENIRNVKLLVEKQEFKNVLLVTHAYHIPRAVSCCQKLGLKITPSGCGKNREKEKWKPWYTDIFPSTGGFSRSSQAIHEWIGITWYWVTKKA